MNSFTKEIRDQIKRNNNVLIVGRTNSGKTYFVEHELIPFLNKDALNVGYFKNLDEFILNHKNEHFDVFIFDEFETFFDRDFLIKKHNDSEYYSEQYIHLVTKWHRVLFGVGKPCVFILTRNDEDEINYIVDNMKQTDWGSGVVCFKFERF